MIEMIITSSILIAVIFLLRRMFGRQIDVRLRYGLWLLVALRLVLPVNIGTSGISALNLLPQAWQSAQGSEEQREELPGDQTAEGEDTADGGTGSFLIGPAVLEAGKGNGQEEAVGGTKKGNMPDLETSGEERTDLSETEAAQAAGTGRDELTGAGRNGADDPVGLRQGFAASEETARRLPAVYRNALYVIWIAGIFLVGGYMTLMQLLFVRYLYRNREAAPEQYIPGDWAVRLAKRHMKVYQIKGLPSPCLAGRSIYIDTGMRREKDRLSHILAHEYCHARQHDTLWALLRSVLTAVYWFHPLVWAAAYGAKQDSELACDAAAIRLLGEENRYEYGRTLLYLLEGGSRQKGYAGMVLTMDGKKRSIRERVSMITKRPGRQKWAVAMVCVILCVSCGCAFTGAKDAGQAAGSRGADGEEAGAQTEEQTEAVSGEEAALAESEARAMPEEEETRQAEEEAKRLAESESQAEGEMSVWEQSQAQLKAKLTAEEQRLAAQEEKALSDQAFQRVFQSMDVNVIMQDREIDQSAYSAYYLGDRTECPLEDGTWYLLHKDTSGITLYGLYTEEYGCYGIALLVGEDMNFFQEEWLPDYMLRSVEVLEWAEDGLPRTFAFRIRQTNTGISEIWKLYVADRYDTGQIDLYPFPASLYQQQLEEMMAFSVQQDSGSVLVICEGDMVVGEIDVSAFEDYVIEDVVWDGDAVLFRLDDPLLKEDTGGETETSAGQENAEGQITMVTGIGLKLEGRDEVWYHGLPAIVFPVNTGAWGGHEMTLGTPQVSASSFISRPQTALPDVEEKLGRTPIHLTEQEN